MIKVSDEQLVKNFLNKDDSAFPILLGRYLKPIYNFIYQMVRNRNETDDLTQDTFIKVWKNLSCFDQTKSFKTWVYTIAKNTVFDHQKKKKTLSFSFFTDREGKNKLEESLEEKKNLTEFLEEKEQSNKINQAFNRLPLIYRTIFILHYKEGFSLKEIAKMLKIPYNTVKSRHRRGALYLKNCFKR